jgi:hypothetical protein
MPRQESDNWLKGPGFGSGCGEQGDGSVLVGNAHPFGKCVGLPHCEASIRMVFVFEVNPAFIWRIMLHEKNCLHRA